MTDRFVASFAALARSVREARWPLLLAAVVAMLMANRGAADQVPPSPAPPPGFVTSPELGWDETEKTFFGLPEDTEAKFNFTAKNTTGEEVAVTEITPSCGCTVVDMPAPPWTLAPGATRTIRVTVDLRGKRGDLEKTLRVVSSLGEQTLLLRLFLPGSPLGDMRVKNQAMAGADRQAVFHGQCARCHVPPAKVVGGEALFQAACAICHEASHRASMVPDLTVGHAGRDAAFWTQWISEGREGSLMPAFALKKGGVLAPEQIAQLVDYLTRRFPAQSETVPVQSN